MAYEPSQLSAMRVAQKKIHGMFLQEQTGVKFNSVLAEKLLVRIDLEMANIASEVEPQLPPRNLSASNVKLPPKKQIKINGEPTAHSFSYFPNLRLLADEGCWVFDHPKTDEVCKLPWHDPLITEAKMELSNQADIKSWLLEQGWSPTLWNYKKDSDGKFERDEKGQLIQTSPKIQEAGSICKNLLAMDGDLIKPIVKWLSLRNRRSVIKAMDDSKETGWLNHPRLAIDGRLPASWSSVAKSHRIQHKIVCNVPKADPKVVLGHEMRSLFMADDGYKCVGYDAAGLEARVMAHFTIKYDKGAFAKLLLEGDIHSYTAVNIFPEQVGHFDIYAKDFNKDDPTFKPWRSKAKAILYASVYGASAPKIAKMVGVSVKQGERIYAEFWDTNWALAMLRDDLLKHWKNRKKKSIVNPVSGAIISVDKEHTVLNYLFQNTGAFVMDVANHILDTKLGDVYYDDMDRPYYMHKGYICKRVVYYH
jgi:hypothetical protein